MNLKSLRRVLDDGAQGTEETEDSEAESCRKAAEQTEISICGSKDREASPPDAPVSAGPKRFDFPTAKNVPGQEGFVLSPYNNKIIDIRDIKTGKPYPRGILMSDPTYPPAEKKYFFVP